MTGYASRYFQTAIVHLQTVATQAVESVHRAAQAIAASLANDKDFLTFGSGHSELVAHEAFWRAGGLAPTLLVQDPLAGDAERIEGMAALVFGHYTLRPGSSIIVVSNSGINALPIEAALLCKDAGLTVIAITSVSHYADVPSRHSSGQKLYQVADIVIDTLTPCGDTLLELPTSHLRTGGISTLVGVAIIEAIIVETAALLEAQGLIPPLLVSANIPEGDVHNLALKQRYLPRLVRFPVDTADLHRPIKKQTSDSQP